MQAKLSSISGNDFGQYWLLIDQFYHTKYYSPDYADRLAEFLNNLKAHKVLDAACGIGFPSIDLLGKGFDLTCSDGDDSMLEVFRQRLIERHQSLPLLHSKWIDLPQKIREKFDTILCLDTAITYVDSWADSKELDVKSAKADIKKSLSSFFDLLIPGGRVVIGIPRYAFGKENTFTVDYGTKNIENVPVHHKWEIEFDPAIKRKIWRLITEYDGKKDIKEFQSYMLYPDELQDMLKEVGFRNIRLVEIKAGEYDNNFIAEK